jgi:hypothetical protein
MFMIHGGVYTDMTFSKVEEDTDEVYGPFASREQAVMVWRGKMGQNIDICEHRLFVVEVE